MGGISIALFYTKWDTYIENLSNIRNATNSNNDFYTKIMWGEKPDFGDKELSILSREVTSDENLYFEISPNADNYSWMQLMHYPFSFQFWSNAFSAFQVYEDNKFKLSVSEQKDYELFAALTYQTRYFFNHNMPFDGIHKYNITDYPNELLKEAQVDFSYVFVKPISPQMVEVAFQLIESVKNSISKMLIDYKMDDEPHPEAFTSLCDEYVYYWFLLLTKAKEKGLGIIYYEY